jgi:gas vesicle protein
MKTRTPHHREYSFAIGLAAGTFVGACLAIWLAPRLASELRERITDSAKDIGQRASEHFEHASARVSDAVETLTRPRAL